MPSLSSGTSGHLSNWSGMPSPSRSLGCRAAVHRVGVLVVLRLGRAGVDVVGDAVAVGVLERLVDALGATSRARRASARLVSSIGEVRPDQRHEAEVGRAVARRDERPAAGARVPAVAAAMAGSFIRPSTFHSIGVFWRVNAVGPVIWSFGLHAGLPEDRRPRGGSLSSFEGQQRAHGPAPLVADAEPVAAAVPARRVVDRVLGAEVDAGVRRRNRPGKSLATAATRRSPSAAPGSRTVAAEVRRRAGAGRDEAARAARRSAHEWSSACVEDVPGVEPQCRRRRGRRSMYVVWPEPAANGSAPEGVMTLPDCSHATGQRGAEGQPVEATRSPPRGTSRTAMVIALLGEIRRVSASLRDVARPQGVDGETEAELRVEDVPRSVVTGRKRTNPSSGAPGHLEAVEVERRLLSLGGAGGKEQRSRTRARHEPDQGA